MVRPVVSAFLWAPLAFTLPAQCFRIEQVKVVKRVGGQADAIDDGVGSYLTPVTVGNQTFNMQLDTGSQATWVWSVNSSVDGDWHAGEPYDPVSPSAVALGFNSTLQYGGGDVTGPAYTDDIAVAGLVGHSLQVIAGADGTGSITVFDGILGMGISNESWWSAVKDTLPSPYWAADLNRGAPGVYSFGELPTGYDESEINWVGTDGVENWVLAVTGYGVGNDSLTEDHPFAPFVDTGTSGLLIPSIAVDEIYSSINSSFNDPVAGWTIPCDGQYVQDVNFDLGGFIATIPGKDVVGISIGDGRCNGNIGYTPSFPNGMGPAGIVGDLLFWSYIVVFKDEDGTSSLGFIKKHA